jgi:hypothetical protein
MNAAPNAIARAAGAASVDGKSAFASGTQAVDGSGCRACERVLTDAHRSGQEQRWRHRPTSDGTGKQILDVTVTDDGMERWNQAATSVSAYHRGW